MRGVVNDLPVGMLALVVVGLIVGAVAVAVLLVRRLVPATRDGFDAEVSSQMLGVVASMFGLLLAFVVVIAYQAVGDAQSNVELEANSLAAIVRDAGALPPTDERAVTEAVATYARAIVEDEWPRMRTGGDSEVAFSALGGLYGALQRVEPRGARAQSFYDDAIRQLSAALDARRNRLADRDGGMSPLLAALIIVGALVILGYATLVGSSSTAFHVLGAGSIALVLGFALLVLLALSYPFSGSLAIDPAPFRESLLGRFSGVG